MTLLDTIKAALKEELGDCVSPGKLERAAQKVAAPADQVALEMTNAGWTALKAAFLRFGVDVMALPFDHDAGFINSDAPLEIYRAMISAALSEP